MKYISSLLLLLLSLLCSPQTWDRAQAGGHFTDTFHLLDWNKNASVNIEGFLGQQSGHVQTTARGPYPGRQTPRIPTNRSRRKSASASPSVLEKQSQEERDDDLPLILKSNCLNVLFHLFNCQSLSYLQKTYLIIIYFTSPSVSVL